jgi:UDP-glucose 4-epimerase
MISAWKGHRVVVTGAAGFIGSHVAARLSAEGAEVVAIDDLSRGHWKSLHDRADQLGAKHPTEITIDLSKPSREEFVSMMNGASALIHLAAEKYNNSADAPDRVLDVNVAGTQRLFDAAGIAKVPNVVFSSSLYACGRLKGEDLTEDEPPIPITVYGASKLSGEALLRAAAARYGFRHSSLRFFFVFGPGQAEGTGYPSVLVRSMHRILNGEPPIINGDGKQALDYIFIDDVVRAVLMGAESRFENGALLNIGTGRSIEIAYLIDTVIKATGTKLKPIDGAADWTAGTRRVARTSKAAASGWKAETSFEDGVTKMWNAFKNKGAA